MKQKRMDMSMMSMMSMSRRVLVILKGEGIVSLILRRLMSILWNIVMRTSQLNTIMSTILRGLEAARIPPFLRRQKMITEMRIPSKK